MCLSNDKNGLSLLDTRNVNNLLKLLDPYDVTIYIDMVILKLNNTNKYSTLLYKCKPLPCL